MQLDLILQSCVGISHLRDLVAYWLVLVMIVLLIEQGSVDCGGRIIDGCNCGGYVGLAADGQVHGMLKISNVVVAKVVKLLR